MSVYVFIEVNSTKKTKIKAKSPKKAIEAFLRRFPNTVSHRVVGHFQGPSQVYIHYNDK